MARHLVVAGNLVDEDPELALAHARAARDRASRIAVVREAVGVAAYHAGDYAEASRELRAYRRMSGDESYRAVLADCERAQGRPEVALRLVREALAEHPDRAETVELQLVEAGVRQDLDEVPAARLVLEGALGGRPSPTGVDLTDESTRRLASAYADLLTATDDPSAEAWRDAVAAAAPEEDDDVAFGEEELPVADEHLVPEAVQDEPATGRDPASDAASDAGEADREDPDSGGTGTDDAEAHTDAEDGADDAEYGTGSDPAFDEDVEREVAELLGEVEPPTGDDPGH
ncbi:tetratricopeptide repeat protein [Geodermatophilus amargosae]|uniref:tetratricopeptide repeat protein n=1 Tax=Geodermatophilus amargosae TaxID=1296565 RepID=UPI0034E0096D